MSSSPPTLVRNGTTFTIQNSFQEDEHLARWPSRQAGLWVTGGIAQSAKRARRIFSFSRPIVPTSMTVVWQMILGSVDQLDKGNPGLANTLTACSMSSGMRYLRAIPSTTAG